LKTIFVTGATGNQGAAVAASLFKNGFAVKALVRKPDPVKAQNLKDQQVELVRGDLNDPDSFRDHLRDMYGVFSVQTFKNGIEREIKQGKDLADLAKEYGVKHFVYSSVSGADLNTGVPHFDSKHEIEKHIKQLDLPYTIIRPVSFFENFLIPEVKSRILKGKLASPIYKNKVQQFISVADIGEISSDIFLNKDRYLGKTITIGAEEMDMQEAASIFSQVLGKEIKYQKLPMLIVRLFMGKNLYKMFNWINNNDPVFIKDLETFKKAYSGLTGLKEWVQLNFHDDKK